MAISEIVQNIKKTRDKVRLILQEFPDTRNNDNLLCCVYWREVDGIQDLAGIQFATPAEAIRRNRQLLNAEQKFLATEPEVLEKRRQKAKEIRVGITRI